MPREHEARGLSRVPDVDDGKRQSQRKANHGVAYKAPAEFIHLASPTLHAATNILAEAWGTRNSAACAHTFRLATIMGIFMFGRNSISPRPLLQPSKEGCRDES